MASPVELRGRRVAVVGLGKSGLAVARFCAERGAEVTGCDDRDEAALHDALTPLQSHRAAGRLRLALGGLRPEPLVAADLIVLSPGVPPTRAPIATTAIRGAGLAATVWTVDPERGRMAFDVERDDPHLPALRHEPRLALTPEGDGLGALREIVGGASAHLAVGAWLLLEHGYDQAEAVRALLSQAGFSSIASRRDLGGQWRCSGGRWST